MTNIYTSGSVIEKHEADTVVQLNVRSGITWFDAGKAPPTAERNLVLCAGCDAPSSTITENKKGQMGFDF